VRYPHIVTSLEWFLLVGFSIFSLERMFGKRKNQDTKLYAHCAYASYILQVRRAVCENVAYFLEFAEKKLIDFHATDLVSERSERETCAFASSRYPRTKMHKSADAVVDRACDERLLD
jgi:hypothetical protein